MESSVVLWELPSHIYTPFSRSTHVGRHWSLVPFHSKQKVPSDRHSPADAAGLSHASQLRARFSRAPMCRSSRGHVSPVPRDWSYQVPWEHNVGLLEASPCCSQSSHSFEVPSTQQRPRVRLLHLLVHSSVHCLFPLNSSSARGREIYHIVVWFAFLKADDTEPLFMWSFVYLSCVVLTFRPLMHSELIFVYTTR